MQEEEEGPWSRAKGRQGFPQRESSAWKPESGGDTVTVENCAGKAMKPPETTAKPGAPTAVSPTELYRTIAKMKTGSGNTAGDIVIEMTTVNLSGSLVVRVLVRDILGRWDPVVTYLSDERTSQEVFGELHRLLTLQRLTPELREWALKQHTEEEMAGELRDARENGGPDLADVINELKQGT
jgi:hypothetical protein